ncbi:response regulator, partial [Acinetobacter baumannii]
GAVVVDCDVEDSNEFELLSRLRQKLGQNIPIVFLMTSDLDADEERAFRCGATRVFRKPFQPKDLVEFLHMVHPAFKLS